MTAETGVHSFSPRAFLVDADDDAW